MYMEGHIFVHCCIYIPNVETFRVVGLKKKKTTKKVFNSSALQGTFLQIPVFSPFSQKSARSLNFS